MADFGRGVKAGAAAATIYLIISVILATIGAKFWYPSGVISAAGLGISPGLADFPFVIYSILSYVVRGIVFGAVFAALYNFLPGTTSVKKGVVLSAFLWILGAVGLIYITPGWPTDGGQAYTVTGPAGLTICLSSVGLALVSIVFALAFGALVGAIWNKLKEKKVTEVKKGIAVLLVSFILGGVYWVSGTVAFLIGVVIRGAPLIEESGPFWWGSILYASVIFLGLPGWILARAAWKKTKVNKSGFRWGVAGGVMMALTGIMLLPGVLAIIGGVLSGRRPATEPSTAAIEQ
jgi:hypothetical protein